MTTESATQICENILREEKRYNQERKILPSEVVIIDRLLARSTELRPAYEQLVKKLGRRPPAVKVFLSHLLYQAAFFNPKKLAQARDEGRDLVEVNQQIAMAAAKLADLMERRSELSARSGFSIDSVVHVVDVMEEAAKDNGHFRSHLSERLQALREFDLKYWPRLASMVRAIGTDASHAVVRPSNPLIEAGTSSTRRGLADFFNALEAAIKEEAMSFSAFLPIELKLTDNALAILASCALGPEAEEVDAAFVKRWRQRGREKRAEARGD